LGDMRKVQQTPGGTFFVCLPKAWAVQQGLKRGSIVSIAQRSDGRLMVDPMYDSESSPRTVALVPGPFLDREIVGKYLLGFDIIRVEVRKRISFEARATVKETASRLIGLEIVEEDYSGIVLQCLLDPSGFPPEKILRRGYAIAAGMHRDAVSAFIDGDARLAGNVEARDEEVNRLYFLLVRILRPIVQNPSIGEKLGIRPIECLDFRLVASLVEAIGDESVNVASKVVEMANSRLAEDLRKLFLDLHAVCFGAHEKALSAFFSGDVEEAQNVKKLHEKIESISTGIEKVDKGLSIEVLPQILSVSAILRQIYEHSVDIADLAMPKEI